MMKPRVYIETTIPSYLTAWPSRDLIRSAHQQLTREWWAQRTEYELFVSELVLDECRAGDPIAAADRVAVLVDLPLLEQTEKATALASVLIRQIPLPQKAEVDAFHIALAAVHGMQYLLTWNCAHIANAALRKKIESICRAGACEPPTICTPRDLLAEEEKE